MSKEEAQAVITEINQWPGWKAEIARGQPFATVHAAYQVGSKSVDALIYDVKAPLQVYRETMEKALETHA
jgi:hypothetical protein